MQDKVESMQISDHSGPCNEIVFYFIHNEKSLKDPTDSTFQVFFIFSIRIPGCHHPSPGLLQ